MTGLKVVDDHTFTIKTTEKVSNLPVRLGYSAFAPLPGRRSSPTRRPSATKPIGSGPFKLDSWTKEQSIVLSKFADYSGDFGGNVDKVTFKIYQDADAAYNDVLANNLDVTDEIPASALIDDKYKSDLPDRNAQKESGVIQTITAAPTKVDPNYADPKIRQAISMAIDRETIIKQIFNGTRVPATGWVSPVVDGYKAEQCGEFCKYDPAKAKALLAEAGGFKGDKITLAYNADAAPQGVGRGHLQQHQAGPRRRVPGRGVVDFATFRSQDRRPEDEGHVPYRLADGLPLDRELPHARSTRPARPRTTATTPTRRSTSSSRRLLLPTDPRERRTRSTRRPRRCSPRTWPSIPMWYGKTTMGWSDKVTGVKITAFGTIDLDRRSP